MLQHLQLTHVVVVIVPIVYFDCLLIVVDIAMYHHHNNNNNGIVIVINAHLPVEFFPITFIIRTTQLVLVHPPVGRHCFSKCSRDHLLTNEQFMQIHPFNNTTTTRAFNNYFIK